MHLFRGNARFTKEVILFIFYVILHKVYMISLYFEMRMQLTVYEFRFDLNTKWQL